MVVAYLVEGVQHLVGHVVLDHHRRYEDLVEVRVLRPEGLVDRLAARQGLPRRGSAGYYSRTAPNCLVIRAVSTFRLLARGDAFKTKLNPHRGSFVSIYGYKVPTHGRCIDDGCADAHLSKVSQNWAKYVC